MLTVEDYNETLPELIKLAHNHVILSDFMHHNHTCCKHDNRKGEFILSLRISPHVWAPVRWELEAEANQFLPIAFKEFSQSNQAQRRVEMLYDDKSARSLEWQIDALNRHLFDGIPMLVKKGVGRWEE